MIMYILAYLVTFFLGSLVPIMPGILLTGLLLVVANLRMRLFGEEDSTGGWRLFVWISLFVFAIGFGVLDAYMGSLVFSFFGKSPTILMLIMLGGSIIIPGLKRIVHAYKINYMMLFVTQILAHTGTLIGLIIGGFCVL